MRVRPLRGQRAAGYVAIIAAFQFVPVCSRKASDCPVGIQGVQGESLLQQRLHHDVHHSTPSDGLYIVIVTGISTKDVAARMQQSMVRRLRPQDRYVHICETGCAALTNGSLHNVVEMDKSVFPGGRCWLQGEECDGYQEAQMKFVFGLVHQMRELKNSGAEMPGWWLIKDDDTYVHVPNLMKSITHYRPTELVSFGDATCFGVCGGAGWLLSNALAERLALNHGDRWMKMLYGKMAYAAMSGNGTYEELLKCWDMHIPQVVRWVPEARLFWHPGMQFASPFDDQCTNGTFRGLYWDHLKKDILSRSDRKGCDCHWEPWSAVVRPLPESGENIGACHSSSACLCSLSSRPCTWHLQASKGMGRFEAAIELLDSDSGLAVPVQHA
mmetsp:Transcript_77212/g.226450  ORF Transcript_77212/g.226450 Transcript_77212/m.226450 type:complete len:384 (+) Transcript_77212:85-1236(+)